MTVSLAVVLLALAGYVLQGTADTTRATGTVFGEPGAGERE